MSASYLPIDKGTNTPYREAQDSRTISISRIMKISVISMVALAGVASAATSQTEIITFSTGGKEAGGYVYGVDFGTDSFNTHNKSAPSLTTSAEKVVISLTTSKANTYTTYSSYADPDNPSAFWTNSAALNVMNTELGTSLTLANLDAAPLAYAGAGGATITMTLDFDSKCKAGETFVGYLLFGSYEKTATNISLTGLSEGYTVEYATAKGSGFSSTASFTSFTEGKHYTTLIKVTGTFANDDARVTFTSSDAKGGFAMAAYKVVPEPTTATLSLLALAGLAARRRRKQP